MSDPDSDASSKEFEASAQRLERAREKGDAVRSEELQASVSFFSFSLVVLLVGNWILNSFSLPVVFFWDRPVSLLKNGLEAEKIYFLALSAIFPVILTFLLVLVAVFVFLWSSKGLVLSVSKIEMKISKISVLENFKKKFGAAGIVDFLRRVFKVAIIGVILVFYFYYDSDEMIRLPRLSPGQISAYLANKILFFLFVLSTVNLAFGVFDFFWQRYQFQKRNRMTRKEVMDEQKESDGDPHFKSARRQRAEEIARNKMLTDVPLADVIIVNPTHYAVALKWHKKKGQAPICVAKGVDEIALRIRELAQTSGVPIHRDPTTARLLYKVLNIGDEIHRDHYAAVAAAIRFANVMRHKAKSAYKGVSR